MFGSYYNNKVAKACPISELEETFAAEGNASVDAACGDVKVFDSAQWAAMSDAENEFH